MPETRFAVTFRDPDTGDRTTLNARQVGDSELGLGFVAISDFVFDAASKVVIDPNQEALERKYAHVRRLHLNLYSILAIAEIGPDNAGIALTSDRSNLVVLRPPDGASE